MSRRYSNDPSQIMMESLREDRPSYSSKRAYEPSRSNPRMQRRAMGGSIGKMDASYPPQQNRDETWVMNTAGKMVPQYHPRQNSPQNLLTSDPYNRPTGNGMSYPDSTPVSGYAPSAQQPLMREKRSGGGMLGANIPFELPPGQSYAEWCSKRPCHAKGGTISPKKKNKELAQHGEELAHFNPYEMRALKQIPGAVRNKTSQYPKLAHQGRGGDTQLGQINKRTAHALDQLIHQGHEQINPRTGLREYVEAQDADSKFLTSVAPQKQPSTCGYHATGRFLGLTDPAARQSLLKPQSNGDI